MKISFFLHKRGLRRYLGSLEMVTGAGLNFSSMQIARAVRRSPIATLGMKSARMTAFAQGVDLRDLRPERARALSIRIRTGARVIHEWQHPLVQSRPRLCHALPLLLIFRESLQHLSPHDHVSFA